MTTMVRWSPFGDLDSLDRRLRQMLDMPVAVPATDVYETESEYVVELEVPGYEEKELGIELSDHVLTVTGERHEETGEDDKSFRLRERLEDRLEPPLRASSRNRHGASARDIRQRRADGTRAEGCDSRGEEGRDLEGLAKKRGGGDLPPPSPWRPP
jgi:hypothetical protein